MSADTAAVLLVLITAPAQTMFVIFYGTTSPWWTSLIGRALMTKALGLALLIDISLLYNWLGDDYPGRGVVRLVVFGLIAVGAWLQLWAFVREKRRTDHERERTF